MLTVKQQQTFLKYYYAYYDGAIDGIKGSGTTSAIKLFQENHGLTADGIWGTNTDSKSVSVTKAIQKALNENNHVKTPISDKIEDVLTSEKVEKSKIKAIKDYSIETLGENANLLDVDGILGNATIQAVKEYQKANDLDVDGVVGINTITKLIGKELATPLTVQDWSLYPNFTRDEFVCKCGGQYCNGDTAEMHTAVMDILQSIRNYVNQPIIITSGVRCPQHNRNVDGTNSSRHKLGKAIDFYVKGCTVHGDTLVNLAYKYGARYSYNIDGYAVHIDVY